MKYLLDFQAHVAEKLPDDGTLLSKHVGAGTWYEVCFLVLFYYNVIKCILLVFKNMELNEYYFMCMIFLSGTSDRKLPQLDSI